MIAPPCPRCPHAAFAHSGHKDRGRAGCRAKGCTCPLSAYAVVKYAKDHPADTTR